MAESREFGTLNELLDAIEDETSGEDTISVERVEEIVGHRAFGPLLLVPGLIAVTPLSGIPTLPSIIGVIVTLISAQIVFGRRDIWLPQRVERASIDCRRLRKAIGFLRPIARVTDKVVRRRLEFVTNPAAIRVAAVVCLIVALTMPPLELLPFTATAAGAVIAVFGLAITVHDGALMIFAFMLPAILAIGGIVYFG